MPKPKSAAAAPQAREGVSLKLAAQVRTLRESQRLPKSFFCLMAGVSRPLLNAIEGGNANPALETLAKLAAALVVAARGA